MTVERYDVEMDGKFALQIAVDGGSAVVQIIDGLDPRNVQQWQVRDESAVDGPGYEPGESPEELMSVLSEYQVGWAVLCYLVNMSVEQRAELLRAIHRIIHPE